MRHHARPLEYLLGGDVTVVRTRDSARRKLEPNPHGMFAESTGGWEEWLADPGLPVASLETYAGA